ncbi:MAG: hypothetical protein GY861_07995 [bacterium]|nr:hypothetical protein [bacterium]
MYEWDIEDVVHLENQIAMLQDWEQAAEADRKREERKSQPPSPHNTPSF